MPKSRWNDITKAEKNTPEGNRIFAELKEEYMRDYMNGSVGEKVADLEYGVEATDGE